MLKLREPRNAYDLLGLPRSATREKIRARYQQLIRNYRREVAPRQLLEEERFRRLTNAYLLLAGPGRREYDRRLRQGGGREQPTDLVAGLTEAGRLLVEAEAAYAQRKMNDAAELAREGVKGESRNADGYALLGDIFREQGKYNDAFTMYNYAIQFDPNSRRYWQLLEEASALREGRALPKRYRRERATPFNRPVWVWLTVAAVLAAIGLSTLYLRGNWGGTGLFNIPAGLVYAALADGFLLGIVLAATSILMPFDDELISYQVSGFGVEMTPVGILVALPGVVFFWAAPVFYVIVAYLDEHASLSIATALFVCALLTAWLGLLAPEGAARAVYLLAGNFVFFGFLWGWLLGSIRRRVFEH
jgi:curved DNA-binding protein CbpA